MNGPPCVQCPVQRGAKKQCGQTVVIEIDAPPKRPDGRGVNLRTWCGMSFFTQDVRSFATVALHDECFFVVMTLNKAMSFDVVVNNAIAMLQKCPIQPPFKVIWSGKVTRRLQSLFGWGDVSMTEEDVEAALGKAIVDDDFEQLRPKVACLMSPPDALSMRYPVVKQLTKIMDVTFPEHLPSTPVLQLTNVGGASSAQLPPPPPVLQLTSVAGAASTQSQLQKPLQLTDDPMVDDHVHDFGHDLQERHKVYTTCVGPCCNSPRHFVPYYRCSSRVEKR